MVWIVNKPTQELVNYCQYYGVEIVVVNGENWQECGWDWRHQCYGKWCMSNLDSQWVMTLDARDTLFIGNPFAYSGMTDQQVLVSAECVTHEECEWNFKEAELLDGAIKGGQTRFDWKWPVINGGFVAGTPRDVAWLCFARVGFAVKNPNHSDQIALSYMANVFPWGLVKVVPHTEPWVGHGHHWQRMENPPAYAVFHQWQRASVPAEMRQAVLDRYFHGSVVFQEENHAN